MADIERWTLIVHDDYPGIVYGFEVGHADEAPPGFRAQKVVDARQLTGAVDALRQIAEPGWRNTGDLSTFARNALRAIGVDPSTDRGQYEA